MFTEFFWSILVLKKTKLLNYILQTSETRWWSNTRSNLCLIGFGFWCGHHSRKHCWWVHMWWPSVWLLCWCGQWLSTVPCVLPCPVSWWSAGDDQVELHLSQPDNIWSGKTQYLSMEMSRSVIFWINFKVKSLYFVVSNYLNSLAKCPPKATQHVLSSFWRLSNWIFSCCNWSKSST